MTIRGQTPCHIWRIMMDLFEYMRQEQQQSESPLAARIRPATLDEVVGQEHIIG